MIFLSLLAKTFALALMQLHPWLAAGLWLAGAGADLQVTRKAAGHGRLLGSVAWLQVAALVIGSMAAAAADYAAMRWKEGIPVFATLVDGFLSLSGLSVGSRGGHVLLTTMAGPLEFLASIDGMGLKVPFLFLAVALVWLLWSDSPLRELPRKLGMIAGILLAAAIVRMGCVVLLATGLFEFVGYESEELPYRPFMDEAAGVWIYLPFLLAGGVLVGRFLSAPVFPDRPPSGVPRALSWGGALLMLLLAGLIFWEPEGTPKAGKLVISSYHSQWSRSDRPYDREWYGADSGYNYACLKRLFEVFYPVVDATGPLTAADLDGASTLMVYDADRRFTKEEIDLVHEFVRGGGGLFLIGDHTNVFGSASNMNELCEPFGFEFRDDVLFDLDEDFHQVIDAPRPGNSLWHGMSFLKLRGPTSIRPTSVWTRPVYQVGHSKSVRAIYSVNNFYPPPHDDPKMKSGTFCVSAASRYGRGRVVAWADSTIFSNFEIFYPGKYEYLLNTMNWLNHRDSIVPSLGKRMAPLVLFGALAVFLLRRREPRVWLITGVLLMATLGLARWAGLSLEQRRTTFPKAIRPSEWVIFRADAKDPGHHLKDFITEEPYDQRYEVFIQWVLRTGAFSGFHLSGSTAANGLYDHLRASGSAKTSLALIVRKPADLTQLDELGTLSPRSKGPLLLMFASSIPAEQAVESLRRSGIVKSAESLARVAQAWPAGEVVIDDAEGRLLIVANAERYSDQSMGISEKVVPDAAQRAAFSNAFGIIDRLLGKESPQAK